MYSSFMFFIPCGNKICDEKEILKTYSNTSQKVKQWDLLNSRTAG
jgi:hypothetical protein